MEILFVIILIGIGAATVALYFISRKYVSRFFHSGNNNTNSVLTQLAMLQERTEHLQGLEQKIEGVRNKQDSDSRELRERLYNEYARKLQGSIDLLKETYGKISEVTTSAFRELTDKNVDVYRQTAKQLANITERLESSFKLLEQKDHTLMREEMKALRQKLDELERDPLRVQLKELAEAKTAQAVHEHSVKKLTALFWPNNGEIKFNEKIGQYTPDVFIYNHKVRIVADEVTTEEPRAVREKVKQVAEYMKGLNANVGYVIIPNAGIDTDTLREIKRTVPEHGLYVVRLTEFAVSLQVWYDIASTGIVDTNTLIEKGHNFLQVLEPIFDEFLAVMQKIEQRDEQDFKYRQNRLREIKLFPTKVLNNLEKGFDMPAIESAKVLSCDSRYNTKGKDD
jgi:polyhydroxyalkanoate synthesis regulator phasin